MKNAVLFVCALCLAWAALAGTSRADAGTQAPADKAAKLTLAQVAQVRGGMTLVEVMAVLGPRAEINPDPAPFAYGGDEVLVVWREGREKWVGVVFVPDKGRTLRVLSTGATYIGRAGF